jgi:hypothetical protein
MSRCDTLDIIEAAILRSAEVAVTTASGEAFIGRPIAITTRDGDDHVTFIGDRVIAIGVIRQVHSHPT